jgi:hypothetical protein
MAYKVAADNLAGHKVGDTLDTTDLTDNQIAKLLASGAIIKHTQSKKTEVPQED